MQYVSASQINTYRECARKWGWSYLAGIKTPTHPAAALGTEIDDEQLQPYLREGKPFDYSRESGSGYIAASILGYLPQPKTPGMVIQKYFQLPSFTRDDSGPLFGYRGYLDLFLPNARDMPGLEDSPYPAVIDFKSTGNFRWAKTPETLATDVQAQLYATHAMHETGARTVDLVWLYMQTKGPRKSKRVHLRVTSDHVADQFIAINKTALEMYAVRQEFEQSGHLAEEYITNQLEPNASACEAFGGCPFRSKCNLSPDQILDSYAAKHAASSSSIKEIDMAKFSLLENLQIRKNAVVAAMPAPEVVETPPTPPVAETAVEEVVALPINPPESVLPPDPVVIEPEPEKKTRAKKATKVEAPLNNDEMVAAIAALTTAINALNATLAAKAA